MSKISDEIRKWCGITASIEQLSTEEIKVLHELADRIDDEMIELPKDGDGEPIHVGYTVYNFESGKELYVKELCLNNEWYIWTNYGLVDDTSVITHIRPDSLERIADELEDANFLHRDGWGDATPQLREWADRIRKLAKEHEHEND